jgi:ketosteroid isomerase-like protein
MATADAVETGTAFAQAYANGDYAGAEALLAPDVHYREITPNRIVDERGPAPIIDEVREFLGKYDRHEILDLETRRISDREFARTRWRLFDGDEVKVVEWCQYMTVEDGRIKTLDLVCSGPMPEH